MKGLDLSHSSFSNFIVYVLPLLMYTAYNFIRNKYLVIQNTTRCHLCNPYGSEIIFFHKDLGFKEAGWSTD